MLYRNNEINVKQVIYNIRECRKRNNMENDWNRYYTWSVRRDINKLRKDPNNQEQLEWIDYWNDMHFKYRMPYENQALFGLQKL